MTERVAEDVRKNFKLGSLNKDFGRHMDRISNEIVERAEKAAFKTEGMDESAEDELSDMGGTISPTGSNASSTRQAMKRLRRAGGKLKGRKKLNNFEIKHAGFEGRHGLDVLMLDDLNFLSVARSNLMDEGKFEEAEALLKKEMSK
jgi:hypothetical protein